MMQTIYIVLALVIVSIILMYNNLVVARQRVREGASDIDTQLIIWSKPSKVMPNTKKKLLNAWLRHARRP